MTLTTFLVIMIPLVVLLISTTTGLFAHNNKSHGEIWKQINKYNNDMIDRLARIETKLDIRNGGIK